MDNDDKILLAEIKTDVCWIKKIMGNHLKHHWVVTLAVITCSLCTIGSVIVAVICRGQ